MVKLETIRYLLSLTGKEKKWVWRQKNKTFIYIDNWHTPKYHLLTALRYNGYTVQETSENLVFEVTK